MNAHKVHLVSLLSSALSLNRQTTSPILQARLLSLLPPSLTSAFAAITSTNMPVRTTRGRAFERALEALVDWWSSEWEVDWRAGIRYRTWAEAEEMGRALDEERETVRKSLNPAVASSSKGGKVDRKGKGRATVAPPAAPPISKKAAKKLLDALGKAQGGELLRSHKSLQKKALQLAGSRDIGAILFVACCRALGIGARVVVSLQPVGWRMGDGSASTSASKAKGKGKGKAQATTDDDDDDVEMEPVALPTPAPTSAAGTASTSTPAGTTNGGYVRWIDRPPSQRVPGLKSTLGAQLGGYGAGSPGQTLDGKVGTGNPATGAGGSARSKWRSKGRKVGEKSTDPNGTQRVFLHNETYSALTLLIPPDRLILQPPSTSRRRQFTGPRSSPGQTRSGSLSTRSGASSAGSRILRQRAARRRPATAWSTCSAWRRVRASLLPISAVHYRALTAAHLRCRQHGQRPDGQVLRERRRARKSAQAARACPKGAEGWRRRRLLGGPRPRARARL